MKKLLITVLILNSFFAISQKRFNAGFRAGINISNLTATEGENSIGYNFGFVPSLDISKAYGLAIELSYSQQGTNNVLSRIENKVDKRDITINYLSLIVLNKFKFNEKFSFVIGPGLDHKLNNDVLLGNTSVDLSFLAGLNYSLNKNLTIDARVKKGLVDVVETNYLITEVPSSYNTNLVFQFGLTYNLDLK
jgi:opacity protein-like surface antigen